MNLKIKKETVKQAKKLELDEGLLLYEDKKVNLTLFLYEEIMPFPVSCTLTMLELYKNNTQVAVYDPEDSVEELTEQINSDLAKIKLRGN